MNRTALRRAAIGTGVLLAVVLVAAAIFVATFDVNRYTPELVDAVHARTGRTLRFEGDLSLSLFPRLALKLPATTVSEPGREAVFARLQSGAASVALLPLLRGDIAVDAVRVEGLQATIVREKDGRTNIDDLLRPKREAGSGAKGGEPAATGGPTIGGPTIGAVQLNNSNVTWRDLAAGRTVQFSGLDLRAGRYAAGARMPIDASANVSVNDPQLAARIELDADVEWNEQGGLRAIRGLALKGDGTLKKQPMALDAQAERLVLGADAIDVRGCGSRRAARRPTARRSNSGSTRRGSMSARRRPAASASKCRSAAAAPRRSRGSCTSRVCAAMPRGWKRVR
jgi:AsmA protein